MPQNDPQIYNNKKTWGAGQSTIEFRDVFCQFLKFQIQRHFALDMWRPKDECSHYIRLHIMSAKLIKNIAEFYLTLWLVILELGSPCEICLILTLWPKLWMNPLLLLMNEDFWMNGRGSHWFNGHPAAADSNLRRPPVPQTLTTRNTLTKNTNTKIKTPNTRHLNKET